MRKRIYVNTAQEAIDVLEKAGYVHCGDTVELPIVLPDLIIDRAPRSTEPTEEDHSKRS